MKAEELYTSIIESYKSLLSLKGSSAPGLRAYCRVRQISYHNFLVWATTREIASGIKEIESLKKRIREKKDLEAGVISPTTLCKQETNGQPLLYPLHIITGISDIGEIAVSNSALSADRQVIPAERLSGSSNPPHCLSAKQVLYGIRITFPNGVKLSVREADSSGIYSLVYGKES